MKYRVTATRTNPPANPLAAGQPADLLDENMAAEYLKTKPRTLRLWRHSRALPYLAVTPRVIRYRRSDIDAWLARTRTVIHT